MVSKRTQATSISPEVRAKVLARDNYECCICHTNSTLTLAHLVSRARGGKGIPENLLTLCMRCHNRLDQSPQRKEMMKLCIKIMEQKTGKKFNEEEVKYKKWMG